jgi:hypothetical protein
MIAVSDISNLRDAAATPAGINIVTPYVPRPGLDSLVERGRFSLNLPTKCGS